MSESVFQPWIECWRLVPDGEPIVTHSSHLLPVRLGPTPAMLKIPHDEDERLGCQVMAYWDGGGAAPVLCVAGGAILLERALGSRSLVRLAEQGHDDEATRILYRTALQLHVERPAPKPQLLPLKEWFRALGPTAAAHGGIFQRSAEAAERLLAAPRDVCVLHGDLHHDNVLDFGAKGWLAIDPKRLIGERGFDFANIVCNPEGSHMVTTPGRLLRQIKVIADTVDVDLGRQLDWTLAYAGLSAAWYLGDGDTAKAAEPLAVAEMAAAAQDHLPS